MPPTRAAVAVTLVLAGVAAGQAPAPPAPAMTPPKTSEWPKEVGGKTLPQLLAEFRNPDPTARELAIRALPLFGPEAKKVAAKPLIAALDDPDPGVRIASMTTMTNVGLATEAEMKAASEAIRAAITRTVKGSVIRLTAARTLSYFGTDAYYAMAGPVELLDDPWWETRQAAAQALGRMGAPVYDAKAPPPAAGKPAAPKRKPSQLAMDKLMHKAMEDKSAAVRMEATLALLAVGPPYNADPAGYITESKPYLDALTKHLTNEKDPAIRVWLLLVQIMYDDRLFDGNLQKIAGQVGATDPNVRVQALGALGAMGGRAKPAIPEVRQALFQDDASVVAAALACLTAMGTDAKEAIPDLEKLKATTKDDEVKKVIPEIVDAIRGVKKPAPAAAAPPAMKK